MSAISTDELKKNTYVSVACARSASDPLAGLTAATALEAVRAAEAAGRAPDVNEINRLLNERRTEYNNLRARASGDVLSGTPLRDLNDWIDAAKDVGEFVPGMGKAAAASALFLRGYSKFAEFTVGEDLQMQAQRSLLSYDRHHREWCDSVFTEIYNKSHSSSDAARVFTLSLSPEMGSVSPVNSTLDNLRFSPEFIRADELLRRIKPDGSLSETDVNAMLLDNDKRLQEMKVLISENAKKLGDLGQSTNSLSDAVLRANTEEEKRAELIKQKIEREVQAQKQLEFQKLTQESARATVYLIGKIVGGDTGDKITNFGTAICDLVDATSKFCANLEKFADMGAKATAMTALAFSGNVVGIVSSFVSGFGPSTDQMILEQLQVIREQLNELRSIMIEGFQRIDRALAEMHRDMFEMFDRVLLAQRITHLEVTEIKQISLAILNYIEILRSDMETYFQEVSFQQDGRLISEAAKQGNLYREKRIPHISDEKFESFRMSFSSIATKTATQQIWTGSNIPGEGLASNEIKYWSCVSSVADLIQRKTGIAADSRIANPALWLLGCNAMIKLAADFDLTSVSNKELLKVDASECRAIADDSQNKLTQLVFNGDGSVKVSTFETLFDDYLNALTEMSNNINEKVNLFNQKVSVERAHGRNVRVFQPAAYGEWSLDERIVPGLPLQLFDYVTTRDIQAAIILGLLTPRISFSEHKFVDVHWTYREVTVRHGKAADDGWTETKLVKDKVHGNASAVLTLEVKLLGDLPGLGWYRILRLRCRSKESSWLPEHAFTDPVNPEPSGRRDLARTEFDLFWKRDISKNVAEYSQNLDSELWKSCIEPVQEAIRGWFAERQRELGREIITAIHEFSGKNILQKRSNLEHVFAVCLPNSYFQNQAILEMFRGANRLPTVDIIVDGILSNLKEEELPRTGDLEIGKHSNNAQNLKTTFIKSIAPQLKAHMETNLLFAEGIAKLSLLSVALGVVDSTPFTTMANPAPNLSTGNCNDDELEIDCSRRLVGHSKNRLNELEATFISDDETSELDHVLTALEAQRVQLERLTELLTERLPQKNGKKEKADAEKMGRTGA